MRPKVCNEFWYAFRRLVRRFFIGGNLWSTLNPDKITRSRYIERFGIWWPRKERKE